MAPATKVSQLQIRVSPRQKALIRRAAARSGMDMSAYVLSRVLPAAQAQFDTLLRELASSPAPAYPLAQINTFLTRLSANDLHEAVSSRPTTRLTGFLANYVAAMIETACAVATVAVPSWVRALEPLDAPVFGSTLHSVRLHLLTQSPPAFRRRNIFIDSTLGDQV